VSQYQDAGTALAFETRPYSSPDNLTGIHYAAPDTRDYGTTAGDWAYMDLGPVQDADGVDITVPLWAGDNVLRVQNVFDRHNAAFAAPADLSNPRNRQWGFLWSNVHIGSITLNRAADLPALALVTGVVSSDFPAGQPVKRALVLANPTGRSPAEPSGFWKSGYYTYSQNDGAYFLYAPVGAQEIKAGRPDSYQVEGSDAAALDVASSGASAANLMLHSLFSPAANGRPAAFLQTEYFDAVTGAIALLPIDGENGYKMGWVDAGDAVSLVVDAPYSGYYAVSTAYCNGDAGNTGVVKIEADTGSSVQDTQPSASTWDVLATKAFAQPLYLRRGANVVTQTLVSGASDMSAIHLTLRPYLAQDAATALKAAAGLLSVYEVDRQRLDVDGDGVVTLLDAGAIARMRG
jgi:hypothetical protein